MTVLSLLHQWKVQLLEWLVTIVTLTSQAPTTLRSTQIVTVAATLLRQSRLQKVKMTTASSDAFRQIFHSLDVWHKSKGIRKCLSNVGSAKGMDKVALWSDHIVRHFWHCCSLASEVEGNDLEALKILKDTWISLLHHLCNQHEWADGHCDHEPITEENHQLPWFDRKSKEFEALQKIILDPDLLESFKYYTRFRYIRGTLFS